MEGGAIFQLVVSASLRKQALKGLHDDVGHLSRDHTLDLVRSGFYRPFMEAEIEKYVSCCGRCIRRKSPDPPKALMQSILTSEPMELTAFNLLSLKKARVALKIFW